MPIDTLSDLIAAGNGVALLTFIDALSPQETARAISRLSEEEQRHLFGLLSPADAADVIEDIPEAQAADLVEDMPSERAAAIMEELDSDHLVDVLGEIDADTSRAILAKMDHEGAREARMMMAYDQNCAGGLMISEYLAYTTDQTIQNVLDDLQVKRTEYMDYHVQYFYVVDQEKKLAGVLRLHDLLFPDRKTRLAQVMISSPLSVSDQASLKELEAFFRGSSSLRGAGCGPCPTAGGGGVAGRHRGGDQQA